MSDEQLHRILENARFAPSGGNRQGWRVVVVRSAETKAVETATPLAQALGCAMVVRERMGENDRSATGYLPPEAFETAAEAFFAAPETSYKGWETAASAQARITAAALQICSMQRQGDLAIVTHGAVGTLLYCALMREAISRQFDQPGQGHFWSAELPALLVTHGWQSIG